MIPLFHCFQPLTSPGQEHRDLPSSYRIFGTILGLCFSTLRRSLSWEVVLFYKVVCPRTLGSRYSLGHYWLLTLFTLLVHMVLLHHQLPRRLCRESNKKQWLTRTSISAVVVAGYIDLTSSSFCCIELLYWPVTGLGWLDASKPYKSVTGTHT